ncbi:DUF4856 domain-containing protein [Galbibacter mesophilus]|uniref:DUF4856 domain-containing protein n=1 Tax=Galbibacter mesophilus TaxID=379069 RepID=UPI00191E535D|nr:DUF4856 domain-containing protein [Galbibacter mesophilus]MCM5663931.1 DUF4856 domain-containing protein [Galbibacter mesophilus]
MKSALIKSLFVGSVLFASCSSDDDNMNGNNTNEVTAPSAYTFERGSESTVSFSGQTTRIAMATELSAALMDFDNISEALLLNMYTNENNPFSEASLNESTKDIKSKVAASAAYFATNTVLSNQIKADLEASLKAQVEEVAPNKDVIASKGVAGQITGVGSTTVRYVSADGIEYNQVFAKSLIGALMLDQALNNYLSNEVLDAGENQANNDNDVVEEGKNYTTMEHKWDEAFGYVYGASGNPENPNATLGDDSFLNKYLASLESDEDFQGIADDVFNAFKLGRAAIVAKNYTVRDEQAAIIQEKLSLVIGVRAVHYLMGGKAAIEAEDYGVAFHDLSEGYGFLYSLQFTHNPETGAPYFTNEEVEGFIAQITEGENGFWDVSPEVLEEISVKIAAKFNFGLEQA